ncbi:hypothetical protein HDU83_000406 [Entophlyctis luteolus]|nr:hypothetical protein HDU83_000406 [Entophlyctis luteolus]KAJ3392612.1 hypothetical protein HDU84_003861 [Entophlyctis sp. JEL0112]
MSVDPQTGAPGPSLPRYVMNSSTPADLRFFNAQHSPIGAMASFVLGCIGATGGMGHLVGKPVDQNVFIGLQSLDRQGFDTLPFYDRVGDASANFTQSQSQSTASPDQPLLKPFPLKDITRDFQLTTDEWRAGDLTLTIISPVKSIPDAENLDTPVNDLMTALLPVVFVQLKIDNTASSASRRAFFGLQSQESSRTAPSISQLNTSLFKGVFAGRQSGFAALNNLDEARTACHFTPEHILQPRNGTEDNWSFGLGSCAFLVFDVPAGVERTYNLALGWHVAGICTIGIDARFLYNRFFRNLEDVFAFAAQNQNELIESWKQPDRMDLLSKIKLWNSSQQFQIIHAVHSYFGSSQLLETVSDVPEQNGKPVWVMNEGEYRMMNTCDLMVDQVFFEVAFNPWTVKNNLELFLSRYSFVDTVTRFGGSAVYPGGLSFCHDMGVANTFSPAGTSAYECVKLDDCFSHMTCEELLNWILTAGIYVQADGDANDGGGWAARHIATFKALLQSLCNRDAPTPAEYTGLVGMESSRTKGGCEITTYDSLDASLAQTRDNAYIGGKCWAAYLVLEKILRDNNCVDEADLAHAQAVRASATISSSLKDGYVPAILGTDHPAKIIPAIEGLVYPLFTGCANALDPEGEFCEYISAMQIHFRNVLKKGICLFEDGGWKLSSTSINSWLSKIYLNQFIARKLLGHIWTDQDALSDLAHVRWLTEKSLNGYWCWSDQMYDGVATGSLFYPRGVTSILWCYE